MRCWRRSSRPDLGGAARPWIVASTCQPPTMKAQRYAGQPNYAPPPTCRPHEGGFFARWVDRLPSDGIGRSVPAGRFCPPQPPDSAAQRGRLFLCDRRRLSLLDHGRRRHWATGRRRGDHGDDALRHLATLGVRGPDQGFDLPITFMRLSAPLATAPGRGRLVRSWTPGTQPAIAPSESCNLRRPPHMGGHFFVHDRDLSISA